MSIKKSVISAVMLSAVSVAIAKDSSEASQPASPSNSVAVTIYNNDLALVKDQRKVSLKQGEVDLVLRDVSAQIRPETALLRSISHPSSFSTVEQNFDFDLLTPEKMLQKYVGKLVTVVKTNPATGAESFEKATVLSANNGVVLKIGDRIETGMPGRIVYDNVPDNLRDRPTLVTKLINKVASDQTVELSYLTGGLSWKADYVAELNPKEDRVDLSGWVTLSNSSGASYRNAKLQLVAGDVNQVTPPITPMAMNMARKSDMMESVAAAAPMSEQSLLEYHLYSLARPTTIAENQSKQVALLSVSGVPAKKELILQGANYYYGANYGEIGQKLKVGAFISFDNKEANNLGMPLPKGVIRMYKKDSQGNAQFVGEDGISHTPKNEKVVLRLGDSFDVTADKKQSEFKVLPNPSRGNSAYESAYEIVLKNAKSNPVTVLVKEPIPSDWKILSENIISTKSSANSATWKVIVPPESSTKLTYRVLVKY